VVVFTRQLGTMIDAGLPIVQCLDILAAQTDKKKFRGVIPSSRTTSKRARPSPKPCAKHNKIFDDLFVT
jgi:type IV pilus assembly protein PilC